MRQGILLIGVGVCSSSALVMTTLAGDAQAQASKPAQLAGTSVVAPGGRAVVKLTIRVLPDTCRLRVSDGRHWRTLSAVNPVQANLEWSWRVPADARSATWHLGVTCGPWHWSRVLRVRGGAHRRSALKLVGGRVRFRESGAALPAPAGASGEEAPASGPAPNPPPGASPPGNAVFSLESGSCTDWGYFKRPDIYNDRSSSDTNPDWYAWTWAEHARAEGLRVDTSPEVGAIEVWPISERSPVTGHVAYVEALESGEDGETVIVSEMNSLSGTPHWLVVEGVSYEYETEADSLASLEARGVVFIHQR